MNRWLQSQLDEIEGLYANGFIGKEEYIDLIQGVRNGDAVPDEYLSDDEEHSK